MESNVVQKLQIRFSKLFGNISLTDNGTSFWFLNFIEEFNFSQVIFMVFEYFHHFNYCGTISITLIHSISLKLLQLLSSIFFNIRVFRLLRRIQIIFYCFLKRYFKYWSLSNSEIKRISTNCSKVFRKPE